LLFSPLLIANFLDIVFAIEIMMTMTSISIKKETRNQLASIGTKDSTFDEIIQKLIKCWREAK